ncbi:hypothetical protein N9204_00325 [bacterium]|nr:hypothetical protein [bacterium]
MSRTGRNEVQAIAMDMLSICARLLKSNSEEFQFLCMSETDSQKSEIQFEQADNLLDTALDTATEIDLPAQIMAPLKSASRSIKRGRKITLESLAIHNAKRIHVQLFSGSIPKSSHKLRGLLADLNPKGLNP